MLTIRTHARAGRLTRPTGLARAGSVAAYNYCDAVRRGGERWNIQSSIAAITATISPTMTAVRIASVLLENLSTQGETRIHRPTMRLSHSSHSAKANRAQSIERQLRRRRPKRSNFGPRAQNEEAKG